MTKEGNPLIRTEDIEIQLFIEGMYLKYGYDFRGYSRAHMKRRILNRMNLNGFTSISAMQREMLTNRVFFESILPDFSINVTEMFRDPDFFAYLRREVLPVLKSYPQLKIWHAGCSTGEEVYSMAIMLKEEGLYDRTQIYATDFNGNVLQDAKQGVFPVHVVKDYTANYLKAGGIGTFSDYYTAGYDSIILDSELRKNIMFAEHNLVTDGVFGQMHMIICRNVMIYFTKPLQDQVINLFGESLRPGGFLCLGTKETIGDTRVFDTIEENLKIYRSKRNRA